MSSRQRFRVAAPLLFGAISVLFLSGACRQCGQSTGVSVNWDNPIGGVRVASLSAAQARVTFHPFVPRALGSVIGPVRTIFVSDNSVPAGDRIIALLYDTKSYGRVVVEEIRSLSSNDKFNRDQKGTIDDENRNRRCGGDSKVVTMRHGLEGFLSAFGKGGALLIWFEPPNVEMIVRGPMLTGPGAVYIANAL